MLFSIHVVPFMSNRSKDLSLFKKGTHVSVVKCSNLKGGRAVVWAVCENGSVFIVTTAGMTFRMPSINPPRANKAFSAGKVGTEMFLGNAMDCWCWRI